MVENIKKSLDKKTKNLCGVFIDLQKAFDTVNHKILLDKLYHYGVRGQARLWFEPYLTDRKQKVQIASIDSRLMKTSCGVPQGSILRPLLFLLYISDLRPLLFLLYINDLRHATQKSLVHHFADDTNLIVSDRNLKNLRLKMNEELKSLYEWLCANRLSLNVVKTEFLLFRNNLSKNENFKFTLRLNNKTLYESHYVKYLGIIIDNKLNWKSYKKELTKTLGKAIGLLSKIRHFVTSSTLKHLYHSLFNSRLVYGCILWETATDVQLNRLHELQKRAIRTITYSRYNDHTSQHFRNLKILKLNDYLKLQELLFMHDIEKNQLPNGLNWLFQRIGNVHNRLTRLSSARGLHTQKFNTTSHGLSSLRYSGTKALNCLKSDPAFNKMINKRHLWRIFSNLAFESY